MPGLFGISSIATPRIGARVEAARERLLRHGGTTMDLISAASDTFWLGHARLEGDPQTIGAGGERPSAALHGVLHNEAALRQEYGDHRLIEATGDLVAAMYEREGPAFVSLLEGDFAVAVVDPVRKVLLVATDALGNHPIYWCAEGQDFVFSSSFAAVLSAAPARNRLNLIAVADYLTIGAVLEDKTLVEDVHLLDPGTILAFDLDCGEVRRHRYIDSAEFFGTRTSDKAGYLDDVVGAFESAVARCRTDSQAMGLALSGGLDSRAILAALRGQATDVRTYTVGVAGCADQTIAKQLVAIAQATHAFFELDGSYLHGFLPDLTAMVSATDGMYLTHSFTEMLALRSISDSGIGVLLRGHGGELADTLRAWPLHTDAQVHATHDLDEFVTYLASRGNYVTPGLALGDFLSPRAAAGAGAGAVESLRRVLAGASLTAAEACSYLYLRELYRRVTVPSLALFRTRVEVRLPFLDLAFLRVLLGAPAAWRESTGIHQLIITKGLPELLKVRTTHTGAAVDAAPRTEQIFEKVNSVLRKFNVHGYRPHHDLDEWLRISLLETVEAELSGEWARTRDLVSRDAIQELVRSTVTGKANWSFLLMTLLTLELWMRENRIEVAA